MPQAGVPKATTRRPSDRSPVGRPGLHRVLDATGDLFYQWDLASGRMVWFGRAHDVLGDGPESPPQSGSAFVERIVPADRHRRQAAIRAHLEAAASYDCEYRLRGSDGVPRWVHDRGALIGDALATPHLLGSLRLLDGVRRREPEVGYRMTHDALTGHFTMGRFHEAVERAIAGALRHGHSSTVAILEVVTGDNRRGPGASSAGDLVLTVAGGWLDQHLRSTDIVGKLDGDRFGVLLERCGDRAASQALGRLATAILPSLHAYRNARLTWGAAIVPDQARTSLDALAKAEAVLGRPGPDDRPGIYRPGALQAQAQRAALCVAGEIEAALHAQALCLAYQPVADPRSKATRYFECLLRRRLPDGRIGVAADFIAQVERSGLVRRVDRRVLDLTIDELCRHPGIVLACNISGLTATDHLWLRALRRHVARRPDLARRLIVEITETASLPDFEEAAKFVSALHQMGCRVALDDFGTGCTRFRHLRMLDLDIVKIDGTFVDGIRFQAQKQAFLRNLLCLARELKMTTVAERVETAADAAYLTERGVHLLQGYHYGAPTLTPPWRG